MIFVFMQVGIAGQLNKNQQLIYIILILIISALLFSASKYVPKFQSHIFIENVFLDVPPEFELFTNINKIIVKEFIGIYFNNS